jgi:predicted ATP-dependent serine protease
MATQTKQTDKSKVVNFLKGLTSPQTTATAFSLYDKEYGDVSKQNFYFYANQAKGNEWADEMILQKTPKSELSVAETIISSNVKPFVETTIDINNVDAVKFTPLKTNTPFDRIASKRDGWMPGTVYMLTGESGTGKTTVSTNLAIAVEQANPGKTSGFISGEMDQMDWTEECLDNNELAKLKTVFLLDYLDATNYLEILQESFRRYDFCVVDSFEVILDQIKEITGWTGKKAEAKLIEMLRVAAAESGATIIVIQQYTKGGTYVGSSKIKHLLTGLMFVRFDKEGNRYIVFDKNRRGGHMVKRPLYYTKNKVTGKIEFDGARFETELQSLEVGELDNEAKKEAQSELENFLATR